MLTREELAIGLAPIRADLGLLKWMVGVNSALLIVILTKLFIG